MEYISLFFLGAGFIFSVIFGLCLLGIHTSYTRQGRKIEGRIIAFQKVIHTHRSNNSTTRSVSIQPIIEFFFNGEKSYLRGSDQNYLKYEINDKVELMQLPISSSFTMMKNNSYRLFGFFILLGISIPFAAVLYFKDGAADQKILVSSLGAIFIISFFKRLISKGNKKGNTPFNWQTILKNKHVFNAKEYEQLKGELLFSKKFGSEKKKTHLFGIVLSCAFLGIFSFSLFKMWTKLTARDQVLYRESMNSFTAFKDIGLNPDIEKFFIISLLCVFVCIGIYGFLYNLIRYFRT